MVDKKPPSRKKFFDNGKPEWWDPLMEDSSAMSQRLRDDYLEAFTNYGKSRSLRAQDHPDFSKLSGFDPMKGVPLADAWFLLGHPNSREHVMNLRRENSDSAELQNEEKEMKDDFKHRLTNWARSEMEHRPGPDGVVRECLYVLAGNDDKTINSTDLDEIPWLMLVDTEFDLYFSENALRLQDEPSKWFYNIHVWRREDWELLVQQRLLESDDHSAKKQRPSGKKRGRRPIDDTEALLEARKLLDLIEPGEKPIEDCYWGVAEQVTPMAEQTAEPESVTRRIYNKLRSNKTK